jgi:hypothetical protein
MLNLSTCNDVVGAYRSTRECLLGYVDSSSSSPHFPFLDNVRSSAIYNELNNESSPSDVLEKMCYDTLKGLNDDDNNNSGDCNEKKLSITQQFIRRLQVFVFIAVIN